MLTKRIVSGNINPAVGTAGVAQLVEQLICNQQVGGSNPSTSSSFFPTSTKTEYGRVPERSNGADCKSVVSASVVRIHPLPPAKNNPKLVIIGNSFGFSLFLDKVKAGY